MMDTVADATEKRKKKGTTAEKREREDRDTVTAGQQ